MKKIKMIIIGIILVGFAVAVQSCAVRDCNGVKMERVPMGHK